VTTLLLTGFEPFDGARLNPSGEVARHLDGQRIGGATVIGRVLPVSFERLPALVASLVRTVRPDAALGLGLAAGEPVIRLEAIAINRAHSERPDNDGAAPHDRPLDPAGPAARIATVALDPVIARLRASAIPARLSFHAGTHCCNLVLYHLLGTLGDRPGGFIHLPCLPEQAMDTPIASMTLETMVAAVRIAAESALAP
jgi:pyroglutamyl-peptidase